PLFPCCVCEGGEQRTRTLSLPCLLRLPHRPPAWPTGPARGVAAGAPRTRPPSAPGSLRSRSPFELVSRPLHVLLYGSLRVLGGERGLLHPAQPHQRGRSRQK